VSPKSTPWNIYKSLTQGTLTFDAKKGGAFDAGADLVARALARVIGVVVDAVQLAARPLLHVPNERGHDRLEVVGARVWRQRGQLDGVARMGQSQGYRLAVLEPFHTAHRLALDSARQRDVFCVHQSAVVRRKALDKCWRGCTKRDKTFS
jgi:DNA-binding FrmR family transcriptional regulator